MRKDMQLYMDNRTFSAEPSVMEQTYYRTLKLTWAEGSGQAYSIGRLRRPSVHNFKRLLLWNYCADCNQISYTASWHFRKEKFFK